MCTGVQVLKCYIYEYGLICLILTIYFNKYSGRLESTMSDEGAYSRALECPVCIHVFTKPRLIPCGHTVCEVCLEKLVVGSSVTCPIDRSIHGVPEEGISGFMLNFSLISLVDSMCGQCRRRHPEETCTYCANHLCKDCIKGHVLQHEAKKSLENLHDSIIDSWDMVKACKPHPKQVTTLDEIEAASVNLCQMVHDRANELKV